MPISFQGAPYPSDPARLTVNNNFTGQLTNANQTATLSSSVPNINILRLLTGLKDNHITFDTSAGWSSVATPTYAGMGLNAVNVNLRTANGAGFGDITAYTSNGFESNWNIGNIIGNGYGTIDFTRTIVASFNANVQYTWTPLRQSWAVVLSDASPLSGVSGMTPTTTRNYVAVVCLSGNITLQALNTAGANTKQTSGTLDSWTSSMYNKSYRVVIDSGNATLYNGITLLGSISGCPTTSIPTNGQKLFLCASSNAITPQPLSDHINFSNIQLDWT